KFEGGRGPATPATARTTLVGGRGLLLSRAAEAVFVSSIDQRGQVVDVLLREKRDRASAEAFFRRALSRTAVVPSQVVSDHHQPYVKAIVTTIPTACHIRTGLPRATAHLSWLRPHSHNDETAPESPLGEGFAKLWSAPHLTRGGCVPRTRAGTF